MTVKCPKCQGTGNTGYVTSSRCNLCSGSGELILERLPEMVLLDWMKGYEDPSISNEWLEEQLRRLIRVRKSEKDKTKAKKDSDDDPFDESVYRRYMTWP